MRMELAELRQTIETKQQATAKVREGLGSSPIKSISGGLATGLMSAGTYTTRSLHCTFQRSGNANECSCSCPSHYGRHVLLRDVRKGIQRAHYSKTFHALVLFGDLIKRANLRL